jgi:NitT/TauT family transport system ATP-binding protein
MVMTVIPFTKTSPEQKAPLIQAKNLWKRYGDTVVLERMNVTVNAGEFVTMVGASGCGKSTFLKLLLGMEAPSSGELLLDGHPIPQEPDQSRGIVFQQYSVFPHLTVLQNVIIAREFETSPLLGKLFGRAKRLVEAEAKAMLESVGLGHALDRYPHELSGGMKQRFKPLFVSLVFFYSMNPSAHSTPAFARICMN